MTDIQSRISSIREEMARACLESGREPDAVKLLAVSKTMGIDAVAEVISSGQQDLGENYLQDALPKVTAFPDVTWHFIGSIQSKKTRDIANRFAWVHSIATEKVAKRLSEQRSPDLGELNCLIQVNLSNESGKSGVSPIEAVDLATRIAGLDHLSLRGLMCIPAQSDDPALQAAVFSELRELKDEIASRLGLDEFDQLSMGMTHDFIEAIKQGATWIRIGTAIFGPRNTPQSP